MTDELTKLARAEWLADTLDADDIYINLRVQTHHAAVKAKALIEERCVPKGWCTDTIAALDALILTPPVDPLLVEAREVVATFAEKTEGFRAYAYSYRNGLRDADSEVSVALAALKRSLELREGGGE